MTAFEDYITQSKKLYDMKERDDKVDIPHYCEKCDRVWSYHHRLGFTFYDDFPKFQPKKKCNKCRGIKKKVISKGDLQQRKDTQREYYYLRKRANAVEYPLLGRGRITKGMRQSWVEGLEEAEATYYG